MSINLSVISINENKTIFYGNICIEVDICINDFSIKLLSESKIIISYIDKKIIVYFNEIFTLNYFDYIIIYNDKLLNLINYLHYNKEGFKYLIQNDFRKYLSHIFVNIFDIVIKLNSSNWKYLKNLLLLIIIISFILKNDSITHDINLSQEKFLIQKKIYFLLKKLDEEAKPEFIQKDKIQNIGHTLSNSNLKVHTSIYKNRKKTLNIKSAKVIDNETQYFMQLKKQP